MAVKSWGGVAGRVTGIGAAVAVVVGVFTACGDVGPVSNPGTAGNGTGGSGGTSGATSTGGSGGGVPQGCVNARPYAPGIEACDGEFVHRKAVAACPLPERIGDSGSGGQGGAPTDFVCDSDDDCTDRANGYCIQTVSVPSPRVECVYACETDADCGESEVCSCGTMRRHPSIASTVTLGRCVKSTCATDDDCSGGALCIAPLSNGCGNEWPGPFHCQTPADECRGGVDCGLAGVCHYVTDRFTCAVC